MKSAFWLVILVSAAAAVWIVLRIRRKIRDRELAEEARAASLLAGLAAARPSPALAASSPEPQPVHPAVVDDLAQQKLLFESAHKAGEAGEPALAIQLYARLLARYPSSAFADQARAGAESQKKKLVTS